jgi:lycopene beta-cyclase
VQIAISLTGSISTGQISLAKTLMNAHPTLNNYMQSPLLRQLRAEMPQPAWILYILWLLLMIMLPHVLRLGGESMLLGSINASVLIQAAVVLAILWPAWGAAKTVRALLIVATLSWAVEFLGSSTGFPFGSYDYTERLQPQLFHVPLLIPMAWLMMLAPSWAVACLLVGRDRGFVFALVSGVAITAWDLFLDPQMVAWGLWVWEQPGGYFGIPWVNYAGWIATGTLITLAVRPRQLPVLPLLLIYITTWLLESVGLAFFFGLPGPALVGFVVMGGLVVMAMRGVRREA